jgi:aspartate/methionine/tyrosine aminotransferase
MGYTCATDKDMMANLRRISADITRTTHNMSKASAPVMLDHSLDWWRRDVIEHLDMIRSLCYKRLDEIPNVTYPELEGTYLMFPKFDYGKTSDELHKYMLEEGKLALTSGAGFGAQGERHLRICIATSEMIMNEAFDRLEKALTKLK